MPPEEAKTPEATQTLASETSTPETTPAPEDKLAEAPAETPKAEEVPSPTEDELRSDIDELVADATLGEPDEVEAKPEPKAEEKPEPKAAEPEKPAAEPETPKPEEPAKAPTPEAAKAPEEPVVPVKETLEELNELRTQIIDDIESRYEFTPEQQEAMVDNPGAALPKMAATLYVDVFEAVYKAVTEGLPQLIQNVNTIQGVQSDSIAQFYKAWPQLNKPEYAETLKRYADSYLVQNPKATLEQAIHRAGGNTVSVRAGR